MQGRGPTTPAGHISGAVFRRPNASQVPVDSVSVTTGPGPKASRPSHCQNGPLRLGLVGTGVRVVGD